MIEDAQPYLKSLNTNWTYPNAELIIYGENFGDDLSAISVQVGPLQCHVDSVTNNSISLHLPAAFAGSHWNYYQPIRVTVHGMKARNVLSVRVGDTG